MPKISAATLEEHRAETTDRLLDAFGELVMQKGYDGVSLADVANKAGLARTAIYNYFQDRESLLFAWTDREVRQNIEVLEGQITEADTYSEKLRCFVRGQLEAFTSRHLPPGQEVIQFLGPDAFRRFMDHVAPVEAILRAILDQGTAAGEFGDVDPDPTVPMILACIGAERVPLATGQHDVDDSTDRVTDFLLRALTASSPAPKPKAKRAPARKPAKRAAGG
jgi:AcrR family transcriptional regulator